MSHCHIKQIYVTMWACDHWEPDRLIFPAVLYIPSDRKFYSAKHNKLLQGDSLWKLPDEWMRIFLVHKWHEIIKLLFSTGNTYYRKTYLNLHITYKKDQKLFSHDKSTMFVQFWIHCYKFKFWNISIICFIEYRIYIWIR